MGTTIKFMQQSRRWVSFLIEIKNIEDYINIPRKLEAHLFEKLDSILRCLRVNVNISIDTAGYSQVYEVIDLYKKTSSYNV